MTKTLEVSEILLECARDYEHMAFLMKETFDFRMSVSVMKAYEDCIRKAHVLHSIAIPSPGDKDDPWESGELGRSLEHAEVAKDE